MTDLHEQYVHSVNIDTSILRTAALIPDEEGSFLAVAMYSEASQPFYTGIGTLFTL